MKRKMDTIRVVVDQPRDMRTKKGHIYSVNIPPSGIILEYEQLVRSIPTIIITQNEARSTNSL